MITGEQARSWLQSPAFKCVLLFLACSLIPAFGPSNYQLQVANLVLIYVVVAIGQNIVLGYSGQISIAQSALSAIGAYTSALLMMKLELPFLPAAGAAVLLAMLCGALLGILTMRVRTHYLLLVTIGFHIVVLLTIVNLNDLTGGPMGLYPIPPIELAGLSIRSQADYYRLYLPIAVLLFYVAERIRISRLGLAMLALKNNEIGARAAGIDPTYSRVLAMALAGLYAGVGGVMFAFLIQFLGPESFNLHSALLYLLMVVVGGMGNNWGLICSALGLTLLSENLKVFAEYWVLAYGLIIMVVIAVAPGGLAEVAVRLTQCWMRWLWQPRERRA
jgi:branched-chain amino acid transport system permease protein